MRKKTNKAGVGARANSGAKADKRIKIGEGENKITGYIQPKDARESDAYLWEEGVGKLIERGPAGELGMPEAATYQQLEEEDIEAREFRERNVSDLNDPGDPEAGDVGLPGGMGSGGDLSDSGSGGVEKEHDDEEKEFSRSELENIESGGIEENFVADIESEAEPEADSSEEESS